jgi:hypothetical protein
MEPISHLKVAIAKQRSSFNRSEIRTPNRQLAAANGNQPSKGKSRPMSTTEGALDQS